MLYARHKKSGEPIIWPDSRLPLNSDWDLVGELSAGETVEAWDSEGWGPAEWLKEYEGSHVVFFLNSKAIAWTEYIRPIRSGEDRAVDEMVELIDCSMSPRHNAIRLYRAGYRKTGE